MSTVPAHSTNELAPKCCVCGKPLGDEAVVVGWNPWNGTQAVHPECEPDYEEDHL
jgi:hypothetical protein